MTKPLLQLKNIHTFYGNLKVLQDVSLDVNENEIVTLIGSNGAGKTTILKTISKLLKPASGELLFKGQNITHLPPHQVVNQGIIHVPEGRCIFPKLTVLENLEMGAFHLKPNKDQQKNLEEVFRLFPRLKERRKQQGGTLSGGEQQMLAMGRALMGEPRILLCDEPSMGLAPILVDQIFAIIKNLNKNHGITILLVEQNSHYALNVAHRGYVLQTGRIVLSGSSKELSQNAMVKEAYLT